MKVETGARFAPVDGLRAPGPVPPAAARGQTALRAAHVLSAAIVGLMVVASTAGLFVHGLYSDGQWAREALRGGDLATLVVAVPLLLVSLSWSARGSRRARPVWIAMLGYGVYNYAYYVFGARFNDLFLLHIALLSCSGPLSACSASRTSST